MLKIIPSSEKSDTFDILFAYTCFPLWIQNNFFLDSSVCMLAASSRSRLLASGVARALGNNFVDNYTIGLSQLLQKVISGVRWRFEEEVGDAAPRDDGSSRR